MNSLKGRKIELLPVVITNEKVKKHCPECEGIGWIEKNKGHIEKCRNCCGNGYILLCSECGKELNSSYTSMCDDCRRKQWTEMRLKEEQLHFQKAEKLTFGVDDDKIKNFEYFYSEDYPYNEGYFADFDVFFDELQDKGITKETGPQYVWGTYEKMINIDVDWTIENACEDLYEGAYDNISNEDFNELKQYVAEWCKKQTGTITYYPDYRYAIMIPWEDWEANNNE